MDTQCQTTFQLASYLLQYPTDDWHESLAEVRRELEDIGDSETVQLFAEFLERVESADAELNREFYVRTFDFGKKTNLYVTYVKYNEERERGPALLSLKQQYANAGYTMNEGELSDYLPLMLEFMANASEDVAKKIMAPHYSAVEMICIELEQIDSAYALILRAVLNQLERMGMSSEVSGGVSS